jgi:aerobic-type carbon monoxide dehydrogenase small subunit (CoxS/CutS family)
MLQQFNLNVNGEVHVVTTYPQRPLLYVLREDLHLTGSKYGCGEGMCRACTVLLDGAPVMSCLTPVSQAENKPVVTIEGLASGGKLHALQEALLAEGMQCGYCAPGMIMMGSALLQKNANPSDEEITQWMGGNLCRCCSYAATLRAFRRAAGRPEPALEVQS